LQRGRQAKQQRRRYGCQQRKAQHASIQRNLAQSREVIGHARQQPNQPGCEQDAERATNQSEHQALGDQLPNQTRLARS
jgi:hypothetical protein